MRNHSLFSFHYTKKCHLSHSYHQQTHHVKLSFHHCNVVNIFLHFIIHEKSVAKWQEFSRKMIHLMSHGGGIFLSYKMEFLRQNGKILQCHTSNFLSFFFFLLFLNNKMQLMWKWKYMRKMHQDVHNSYVPQTNTHETSKINDVCLSCNFSKYNLITLKWNGIFLILFLIQCCNIWVVSFLFTKTYVLCVWVKNWNKGKKKYIFLFQNEKLNQQHIFEHSSDVV